MSTLSKLEFVVPIEVEAADKPPRVDPRLDRAPKTRELYWCDFPKDGQLPEFWKCRPVVIISRIRSLTGAVTVVPCSSQPQDGPWAFKLSTTIDGGASWAICDKPTTVAVSRLSASKRGIRRVPFEEFQGLLAKVLDWLPKLKSGA